jgi:hypothetical protein
MVVLLLSIWEALGSISRAKKTEWLVCFWYGGFLGREMVFLIFLVRSICKHPSYKLIPQLALPQKKVLDIVGNLRE